MSITRQDIADLREGDVVELGFSSGAIVRGPLVEDRHAGGLDIAEAGWSVRQSDGGLPYGLERIAESLTVVSRVSRPLYVNHPRTEPYAGDVVRDADDDGRPQSWLFCGSPNPWPWYSVDSISGELVENRRDELPARLRLLVDGETGMTVPQ